MRVDLYCRIVDNFGDAGVCWRLARQLAAEHGAAVTLWIDDLAALRVIEPDAAADATVRGVRLRTWPDASAGSTGSTWSAGSKDSTNSRGSAGSDAPTAARTAIASRADDTASAPFASTERHPHVVIAAFGCALPPHVRASLAPAAARDGMRPPLWINLEYLSAEAWVDGCHGLSSVKPDDGAIEHFFYPGFTPATGGLLRERGLLETREAFRATQRTRWLNERGMLPAHGERLVSLFCYRDAALDGWLRALAEEARPTRLLVPVGVAELAMLRFFQGGLGTNAGARAVRGALTAQRIAWMPQDDYDRLLWSCDLNVVRGEDSWVRAHWAGRPFLWQPYTQDDHAHFAKLGAFADRFKLATGAPSAACDLMYALAGRGDAYLATRRYAPFAENLRHAHQVWADALCERPDLVTALIEFCRDRI